MHGSGLLKAGRGLGERSESILVPPYVLFVPHRGCGWPNVLSHGALCPRGGCVSSCGVIVVRCTLAIHDIFNPHSHTRLCQQQNRSRRGFHGSRLELWHSSGPRECACAERTPADWMHRGTVSEMFR